jgi:hypothetical protein
MVRVRELLLLLHPVETERTLTTGRLLRVADKGLQMQLVSAQELTPARFLHLRVVQSQKHLQSRSHLQSPQRNRR